MKEITLKALYSLEKKVRNIPGVTDVIFQFLNWRKERGQWVPVEIKKKEEEDEEEVESNL
jgi:predicted RND superfamily exporter protein